MLPFKSAKLYLCFAVLFFVAKPFLGFSMVNRNHPPAPQNILVKSFTKRKVELTGDNIHKINVVDRKLSDPIKDFLSIHFICSALAPIAAAAPTNRFLNDIQLNMPQPAPVWLLNGKLII